MKRDWRQTLRLLLQSASLLFVVIIAFRSRAGQIFSSCETICPFGGMEGMLHFVKTGQYLCVLSPSNVTLFLSLIALTFAGKRIFCSHLCPLGFIFEKINDLRIRFRMKALLPPPGVDRALQVLRYGVLITVLAGTAYAGDLVFRGYDPYFALFSLHSHGIAWTSYAVLGSFLILALFVPMAWCRYCCPLGACMDPFSRASLLRISRTNGTCTHCGLCDTVCPMMIPLSAQEEVRDVKCSFCLKCVRACPGGDTLRITGPGGKFPAASLMPVVLIAGFLAASYALTPLFHVPTYSKAIQSSPLKESAVKETRFIVDGLTCRGRSLMLYENLRYLPGVYDMVTFAYDRMLVLRYDPAMLNEKEIKECIEGAVRDPETGIVSAPFRVVRWTGGGT